MFDEQALPANLSKYARGSICFLFMQDFLTFTQCSLYPGPGMNMIIGPNGTGKSTVVAAIALVLNFPLSVLGRSTDAYQFIRRGCNSAQITIGLAAQDSLQSTCIVNQSIPKSRKIPNREGRVESHSSSCTNAVLPNADGNAGVLFITRRITKHRTSSSKDEWFVNGTAASADQVTKLALQLALQVDNLCQFLPQDRVAKFAMQTPAELLLAMERSMSVTDTHGSLFDQHQQLISMGKEQQSLRAEIDTTTKEISSLQQMNDQVDQIRHRMQQRVRCDILVSMYRSQIPRLQRRDVDCEIQEISSTRQALRQTLAQHEEMHAQQTRQLDDLQTQWDHIMKHGFLTTKEQRLYERFSKDWSALKANLEDQQEDIKSQRLSILRTMESNQRKQEEVDHLQTEINEYKRRIEEIPEQTARSKTKEAQLLESVRKLRNQVTQIDGNISGLASDIQRFERQGERLQSERSAIASNIQKLDNDRNRRLEMIRNFRGGHEFKAKQWIDEHQSLFTGPVFGPIYLEMQVTDAKMVSQVESLFSVNHLLSFVVTTEQDRLTLLDGLRAAHITVDVLLCTSIREHAQMERMDQSLLESLGFSGVVADFIQAPDAVLSCLFNVAQIHRMPVSNRSSTVNVDYVIQQRQTCPIRKYATPEGVFEIRYSRYDSNEHATSCQFLRPARLLAKPEDVGSGSDRLKEHRRRMQELKNEMNDLQKRLTELIAQKREQEERKMVLEQELKTVSKEYDRLVVAESELARLKTGIKNAMRTMQMRRDEIARNLETLAMDKRQLKEAIMDWSKTLVEAEQLNRLQMDRAAVQSENSLKAMIIDGQIKEMETCLVQSEQRLEELNYELEQVGLELDRLKKQSQELALMEQEHVEQIVNLLPTIGDKDGAGDDSSSSLRGASGSEKRVMRSGRSSSSAAAVAVAATTTRNRKRNISMDEWPDWLQEAFTELPKTIDQVQDLLGREQAKRDAMLANEGHLGPNALTQYHQRKEQVCMLEIQLHQMQDRMEKIDGDIRTVHDGWFSLLQSAVHRVSASFSSLMAELGCRGAVHLEPFLEGDFCDYEKWSVAIKVAFRSLSHDDDDDDDEEGLVMSTLSAQKHSGGEKSVSTMLFLLALQQVSDAPFRLVDEINQGMDAFNERMVHNLLVRSLNVHMHGNQQQQQYFLVTPKLLPKLEYHANMHVLCVFNGQGVSSR